MVRHGASIQRDDRHVTDLKAELPRTRFTLFSDPVLGGDTIETAGRNRLLADTQSMLSTMETAGESAGRYEYRYEYEETSQIHRIGSTRCLPTVSSITKD